MVDAEGIWLDRGNGKRALVKASKARAKGDSKVMKRTRWHMLKVLWSVYKTWRRTPCLEFRQLVLTDENTLSRVRWVLADPY